MSPLLGRMAGPANDRLEVPGDVTDGGIDLIQSEAKLRHGASVIAHNRQTDMMSWECDMGTPEAVARTYNPPHQG